MPVSVKVNRRNGWLFLHLKGYLHSFRNRLHIWYNLGEEAGIHKSFGIFRNRDFRVMLARAGLDKKQDATGSDGLIAGDFKGNYVSFFRLTGDTKQKSSQREAYSNKDGFDKKEHSLDFTLPISLPSRAPSPKPSPLEGEDKGEGNKFL